MVKDNQIPKKQKTCRNYSYNFIIFSTNPFKTLFLRKTPFSNQVNLSINQIGT